MSDKKEEIGMVFEFDSRTEYNPVPSVLEEIGLQYTEAVQKIERAECDNDD